MEKVLSVAERMATVLMTEVDPEGIKFPEPDMAAEVSAEISANTPEGGRLELLATAEDELNAMSEPLTALAEHIAAYGSIAEGATPRMASAPSFKERLSIANKIANDFDEVSNAAEPVSDRLKSSLYSMNPGIITLIRILVALDEPTWNSEQIQTFVRTIRLLAENALTASGSTEYLSNSVTSVMGNSGPLDFATGRIVRLLQVMVVDVRAIFQTWLDELDRRRDTVANNDAGTSA